MPGIQMPAVTATTTCPQVPGTNEQNWYNLRLSVDGMTCVSCTNVIEKGLVDLKGVDKASVSVNLLNNGAELNYDSSVIEPYEVVECVDNLGYKCEILANKVLKKSIVEPAKPPPLSATTDNHLRRLKLSVDGMTCASCANLIEKGLTELKGVDKASVSVTLLNNGAELIYDSSVIEAYEVVECVDNLGFESQVLEDKPVLGLGADTETIEGGVGSSGSGVEDVESGVKDLIMTCVNDDGALGGAGLLDQSSAAFMLAVAKHSLARVFVVLMPLIRLLAAAWEPFWHQFRMFVTSGPSDNSGKDVSTVSENVYTESNLATIADRLLTYNGVRAVDTSLALKEGYVVVTTDETVMGPRRVVAAFRSEAGLRVTVSSMGGFMNATRMMKRHSKEMLHSCSTVIIAIVLTLPVLVMTMILPMEARHWQKTEVVPGMSLLALLLFLLVTPVQFGLGWHFHVKAYKTMKAGALGMDFLVSTGTNAAYVYSFIGIVRGLATGVPRDKDTHYFETAAVLITVILLGKYLELYARGRTAMAIHKLNSLKPKTARLVEGVEGGGEGTKMEESVGGGVNNQSPKKGRGKGQKELGEEQAEQPESGSDEEATMLAEMCCEPDASSASIHLQRIFSASSGDRDVIIDAALLQKGDIIRIVEGETVPADGVIITPLTIGVNESMMTGESRVIDRGEGETIFGGTLVVEGSAIVRLTACGDDSVLGRIVSTVQDAQTSKVPIQEVADKIAARFVPAVTAVSAITFVVWLAATYAGVVPTAWVQKEADGNPVFFAFLFALAVWVSACPCAFGLATPTAILVSTGVAASHGILIRRGAALQYAAGVKTIAFDKTGTLTHGNTAVTEFVWCPSVPVSEGNIAASTGTSTGEALRLPNAGEKQILLQLLMRAEAISNHPISKGISLYCSQHIKEDASSSIGSGSSGGAGGGANQLQRLQYLFQPGGEDGANAKAVAGGGIEMVIRNPDASPAPPALTEEAEEAEAEVDIDSLVLVGNIRLLTERGVEIPEVVAQQALALRKQGRITIFYSYGRVVRGVVALSDTVRPEARVVIDYLQNECDISCYMITGDDETTAQAVASSIGLSPGHVYASAKPADKQRVVKQLQEFGTLACGTTAKAAVDTETEGVSPTGVNSVLFVGDGTNDSPALAQANVGVAMAGGTDIAVETGDMVLCKSDLVALLIAIDISKITMRRILLNYVWAFVYNLLLIPFAAGVFYPSFQLALDPMLAGAAMAMSSVSIVASSLLLGFYKPPATVTRSLLQTEQNLKTTVAMTTTTTTSSTSSSSANNNASVSDIGAVAATATGSSAVVGSLNGNKSKEDKG